MHRHKSIALLCIQYLGVMPMTHIQTGLAEINGAKLYYEVAGQANNPAVVFVHAGVADHRLWDGQFDLFAQQYRVIRFDLRGHGQTTSPNMAYSHVEDLRGLLDFPKVERAVLIGCSIGGTAVLDFALSYPQRVTALVLVSSTPSGYQLQGAPPASLMQLIEAQKAGDLEKMAQQAVAIWGSG